jgi:hypothetical protein
VGPVPERWDIHIDAATRVAAVDAIEPLLLAMVEAGEAEDDIGVALALRELGDLMSFVRTGESEAAVALLSLAEVAAIASGPSAGELGRGGASPAQVLRSILGAMRRAADAGPPADAP